MFVPSQSRGLDLQNVILPVNSSFLASLHCFGWDSWPCTARPRGRTWYLMGLRVHRLLSSHESPTHYFLKSQVAAACGGVAYMAAWRLLACILLTSSVCRLCMHLKCVLGRTCTPPTQNGVLFAFPQHETELKRFLIAFSSQSPLNWQWRFARF